MEATWRQYAYLMLRNLTQNSPPTSCKSLLRRRISQCFVGIYRVRSTHILALNNNPRELCKKSDRRWFSWVGYFWKRGSHLLSYAPCTRVLVFLALVLLNFNSYYRRVRTLGSRSQFIYQCLRLSPAEHNRFWCCKSILSTLGKAYITWGSFSTKLFNVMTIVARAGFMKTWFMNMIMNILTGIPVKHAFY